MNGVLHIVPQLPPAIDGVGEYCWHLSQHWPESNEPWQFAVRHGVEATRAAFPGAQIHAFKDNSASLFDILRSSGASRVVLHYVGYGYQPKGIPVWMPAALERWRDDSSGHLVTMFHEMYADSSPLRSPFWVKPWARQIIRRLVGASDLWITSCDRYFKWLVQEFNARPERGVRIPIASNVPPAAELPERRLWPLEFGRKLRLVVFGLPNTRLRALEFHAGLAQSMVRAGLLESIVLLGQSTGSCRFEARILACQQKIGGGWQTLVNLPTQEVAQTLADCDIGLVANDPGTLTKSGVFAALLTNGVVPIISNRDGFPVSSPFSDCVLLNDDDPAGFDALIAELRGTNRMPARRRVALSVARAELSWPRVAEAFHDFVSELEGDSAGSLAAQEIRTMAVVSGRSEVRA